jgi:hypothetical protein
MVFPFGEPFLGGLLPYLSDGLLLMTCDPAPDRIRGEGRFLPCTKHHRCKIYDNPLVTGIPSATLEENAIPPVIGCDSCLGRILSR